MIKTLKSLKRSLRKSASRRDPPLNSQRETKLKNEEGDAEGPETKPNKSEVDGEDPEKNGEGDRDGPETKPNNSEVDGEDPEKNGEGDGEDQEGEQEDPETKLKNREGEGEDPKTKLMDEGDGDDHETKLKNGEVDGEDPQSQGLRVTYFNFKEQAIEYIKQAVQEDNAGNYAKAFPLYMNALEYFKTHLKYEKNSKIRDAIMHKFTEYLRRAEEIRAVIDYGHAVPSASGGRAQPKTKPKVGEGLHSAIVREKPNIKWSDVAGLESAKQALQEAAILPVRFPHFFTGKRRPWRAFLLYGPSGTGKSYLAKAVASEAYSTFFSVSSSDLVSMRMEEIEKLVSNLFQTARESAPSIVFIDEIDSLSDQRGQGNEIEASRRIKAEILVQMQGVGTHDDKVLVLAATQTPYSLDQDIRRRFDKCIYIPLPDLKARQHIFKVHLGDTPNNLNESDFESLARKTEGFSGSDIAVCVKDVLFEPIRKTQDAIFFVKTNEDLWVPCEPKLSGAVQTTMQELAALGLAEKISPPPITRTDFDKVLARQKPTVSKSDIEVHERFTKEFGEEG